MEASIPTLNHPQGRIGNTVPKPYEVSTTSGRPAISHILTRTSVPLKYPIDEQYDTAKRESALRTVFNNLPADAEGTWSKHHMYRTSYRDMSTKTPVDKTDLPFLYNVPSVSATTNKPFPGASYTVRGAAKELVTAKPGDPKVTLRSAPSATAHLRTVVPETAETKKVDDRLRRMAGYQGFFENVVTYPPHQARGVTLHRRSYLPWEQTVTLKHPREQPDFTFDKSQYPSGFGEFVPMSATIKSGTYRDFHRKTGLVTDEGKRKSGFDMPAGYMHYTFPYSQCWQIASVPKSVQMRMKEQSGDYADW
uniref:Uncharacterized protein n=1 Tax=Chromera velia CCMP2878 TaxID=1169474 RepID=A0A0G4F4V5_9ALVE|mmetsp:Transcript_29010/g.56800  ORF Transcript_29010/g.56800 Transcript_29010/m.56800 type:complete len:307 (+) Transcript_29010:116-1036(+)|eukprot:Cvel_15246.t1-p1 / transcript=Cvel_15246.t1 / gene=Cvel_15246 / organism=Chromera_velia_CCMP2878 / gene_product=hypothetical protein / transcript_product=hypothetical protein / location=Cvel_scaffold1116:42266-46441(-) / protein_length=306 / sequence_SO=supercontig / SO=protein_coding / is_pseudo=false